MTRELWQSWDSKSNSNVNQTLTIYAFDAKNNKTNVSYNTWDGSSWVNNGIYDAYTYNANNSIATETHQGWRRKNYSNPTLIHYIDQTTYTYDANNNKTSELLQGWDSFSNSFLNVLKNTYTYDANNNMINELRQIWNISNLFWENTTQYQYTYDNRKNILTKSIQDWDYITKTKWVNEYLYTYTYDKNNNKTSEFQQHRDIIGGPWANIYNYTATYDANSNLTSEKYKDFLDTANNREITFTYNSSNKITSSLWISLSYGSEKDHYIYDANMNLLKLFYEVWDNKNQVWIDGIFLDSYSYDTYNNQISRLSEDTDRGTKDSTHNYFSIINTAISSVNRDKQKLFIYPNPANNIINIQYNTSQKEELVLYNSLGEVIYKDKWYVAQSERSIDVGNFAKGIYIIRIGDVVQKVVVE